MFNMMPYRANQNMTRRENRGYFEDFANDFFRPFFGDFGMLAEQRPMRVDVRDEGDQFVLEADMPGMKKDDLKVEVNDGVLTISANYDQNTEKKDDEDKYIFRERRFGSMRRAFNVEGIREEDITAAFKDGVLTLTLPKQAEPEKPETHTIEING